MLPCPCCQPSVTMGEEFPQPASARPQGDESRCVKAARWGWGGDQRHAACSSSGPCRVWGCALEVMLSTPHPLALLCATPVPARAPHLLLPCRESCRLCWAQASLCTNPS